MLNFIEINMTNYRKILDIEEEVKQIFAKDNITRSDVVKANKLIDAWKLLTDYRFDTTPVLLKTTSNMLDNEPKWTKNPLFYTKS